MWKIVAQIESFVFVFIFFYIFLEVTVTIIGENTSLQSLQCIKCDNL